MTTRLATKWKERAKEDRANREQIRQNQIKILEDITATENKQLWGEDLFKVFQNHISEEGWLTSDWAEIVEKEIPKWDEDYNDNELYKETYQRMYSLEFEDSEGGLMIRPV